MTETYIATDVAEVWVINNCSDERIAEFIESQTGEENVTVVDTAVESDGGTRIGAVTYNVGGEFDFTTYTNPFTVGKFVRDSIVTLTSLSEDDVDEMTAEQQGRVFDEATDEIEEVYREE